jgi:signal transduction histidine kinase
LTSVLQSIDVPLPPRDHVPKSSRDGALAAFAQVATIRVTASRCLICLIDANRQYILAEATPKLSISDGPREDGADRLWIGNAIIPRCRAICPVVLDLNDGNNPSRTEGEHHKAAVVIDDLLEHEQYSKEWFVHDASGPKLRFYAGVPLVTDDGSFIGALSIFDEISRPGLGRLEVKILQDLAETTVRHLESIIQRQELNRGEQMIRGLASFIQGAEVLLAGQNTGVSPLDSSDEGHDLQDTRMGDVMKPGLTVQTLQKREHRDADQVSNTSSKKSHLGDHESQKGDQAEAAKAKEIPQSPTAFGSQEKLLSAGAKSMFGRAASIIRKTSELDGVIIFDASIIANKIRTNAPGKSQMHARERLTGSRSSESDSSDPSMSQSPSPRSAHSPQGWATSFKTSRKPCHILGSAERETSSHQSVTSFMEADLMKILEFYPNGGIIHFDASGNASSTEDDPSLLDLYNVKSPISRTKKKRTVGDAIQAVAPGSRAVTVFPLWNYERCRWFALCLGWTKNPTRTFSPGVDLVYLNAFGNSIMTELSRLDAIATNMAKTTFVQNVSHELRSPLHGILGGVQFLQDSNLNAFQSSMLSSIEMSGRTLLDTIDHVLDYSKVNDLTKYPSGTNLKYLTRKRVSKRRNKRQPGVFNLDAPAIDLALSTEEVVESVFAGASYILITSRVDEFNHQWGNPQGISNRPESSSAEQGLNDRKHVKILLDIPHRKSWMYSIQPGAWRRIVMNIFGNSLKFTDSGYIRISLDVKDIEPSPSNQLVPESEDSEATINSSAGSSRDEEKKIILTISDSGIGMSDEFLSTNLFTPFSQENSFYTGTGLGMSIVQQLVTSLDGSITVRSQRQVGTKMKIEIPLLNLDPSVATGLELHSIPTIAAAMSGKKVCVLEPATAATTPSGNSAVKPGIGSMLVKTLIGWFGAEASLVTHIGDSTAELFICTEPNFESLAEIRSKTAASEKSSIVIFITLDAIEASALRTDVRVLSDQSVVEIVSQPYVLPYSSKMFMINHTQMWPL